MLQAFFNILCLTARFAVRVTVILTGLLLSSLGNAAFAFLQTTPSRDKREILGTYDAQHALNEGTIDAPEFEHYRERYED